MKGPPVNPFPEPLHFDNAGFENGRRLIVVTRPHLRITSRGVDIVPAGFISDGASLPAFLHSLAGHPFAEFLEDAVHHDRDYSSESQVSRLIADQLFRETMWNRPIPRWKIPAFYTGLRLFGARNYQGPTP